MTRIFGERFAGEGESFFFAPDEDYSPPTPPVLVPSSALSSDTSVDAHMISETDASVPSTSIGVQVAVTVRRLWAVDSSAQSFCAALTCFTYHEAHADDTIENSPAKPTDSLQLVNGDRVWSSKHFNPRLRIMHSTKQEWDITQYMLSSEVGPNERRMLLGKRDVVATIVQDLPLDLFPFDLQSLEIYVSLEEDPSIMRLVPMRAAYLDGSPNVADVAYDEIHFPDLRFIPEMPHAQGIRTQLTLPPVQAGGTRLSGAIAVSQAYVCIPVARASEYYLTTAGSVLLVISLAVCFTFVIPATSPGIRLGADLGLLLTMVAFKLYLTNTLPRVPYLTRLDRLAVSVLVLLLAALCSHALVFVIQNISVSSARWLDLVSWAGYLICWTAYAISWVLSCRRSQQQQHACMREKLRTLQAQHGCLIDVTVGVPWPGAPPSPTDTTNEGRRSRRPSHEPTPAKWRGAPTLMV